jgi:type VI secretion system VasD/TssJ family lipoprotein
MIQILKSNILIILITFIFIACSSKESKIEEINNYVSYKESGINFKYNAVKNLNLYDSNAHSLIFTVYQLDNINNLKLFIKEQNSIEKLINGKKFDNSVLSFDKYIILPNTQDVISLDRAKGAKWIVLLAGYYDYLKKEDIYSIYKIELNDSFFSDDFEYKILDINLTFKENRLTSKSIK